MLSQIKLRYVISHTKRFLLNILATRINIYIRNKNLTRVLTNESKYTLKKCYKELWIKISDLIRFKVSNSQDYDKKCMKIKFDFDQDLSLKKTLELYSVTVVRPVFQEGNKYSQ